MPERAVQPLPHAWRACARCHRRRRDGRAVPRAGGAPRPVATRPRRARRTDRRAGDRLVARAAARRDRAGKAGRRGRRGRARPARGRRRPPHGRRRRQPRCAPPAPARGGRASGCTRGQPTAATTSSWRRPARPRASLGRSSWSRPGARSSSSVSTSARSRWTGCRCSTEKRASSRRSGTAATTTDARWKRRRR